MNELKIFEVKDGISIEVKIDAEQETVWVTQKQLSEMFDVGVPAISKHLKNIFNDGELDEKQVVSILEITAADKKVYKTEHYNLDAIISIGYRVNSTVAVKFRKWVTQVLKEVMTKGKIDLTGSYAIEDPIERAKAWIKEQEAKREIEKANEVLAIENKNLENAVTNYENISKARRSKQELWSAISQQIRTYGYKNNLDYRELWVGLYNEFGKLHNLHGKKIDKEFVINNTDYLADCLELAMDIYKL